MSHDLETMPLCRATPNPAGDVVYFFERHVGHVLLSRYLKRESNSVEADLMSNNLKIINDNVNKYLRAPWKIGNYQMGHNKVL